jgi:penicillin-binding protein 2
VKTGTAQVVGIGKNQRYNAKMLPEDLRDNSLFEAFAPADHPQIALALVVENGGWGAEAAGPIARKMLDYYLVDRNAPGAEAAAVALAASATPAIVSPIIGGQSSDVIIKR